MKKIAALLVTTLVFSGCSLLEPKNQMEQSDTQPTAVDSNAGMMEKTTPVMLEETVVTATDFAYDVKEIKAKQGDSLVIAFTNSEGTHDFVIDELGVNSGVLSAGETMNMTIPTDKPGTYEFYCSVGQHREMGMKGVLIIE